MEVHSFSYWPTTSSNKLECLFMLVTNTLAYYWRVWTRAEKVLGFCSFELRSRQHLHPPSNRPKVENVLKTWIRWLWTKFFKLILAIFKYSKFISDLIHQWERRHDTQDNDIQHIKMLTRRLAWMTHRIMTPLCWLLFWWVSQFIFKQLCWVNVVMLNVGMLSVVAPWDIWLGLRDIKPQL